MMNPDRVIMYVCLAVLGVIAACAILAAFVKYVTPIVVWVKRHNLQAMFLAPYVFGMVYYGSTKGFVGRVTYPYTDVETRYLSDAGSYVTNDYVHVAFSKSPVVPDSAEFFGYARPVGSTNDLDWVCMLETTFADFHSPSNVPYANAISNDFQFFTTYTPGPVMHTNGVAVVTWQRDFVGDERYLAMIRTGVYKNGIRVAPNPAITNSCPIEIPAALLYANEGENNE